MIRVNFILLFEHLIFQNKNTLNAQLIASFDDRTILLMYFLVTV